MGWMPNLSTALHRRCMEYLIEHHSGLPYQEGKSDNHTRRSRVWAYDEVGELLISLVWASQERIRVQIVPTDLKAQPKVVVQREPLPTTLLPTKYISLSFPICCFSFRARMIPNTKLDKGGITGLLQPISLPILYCYNYYYYLLSLSHTHTHTHYSYLAFASCHFTDPSIMESLSENEWLRRLSQSTPFALVCG
ncbi:hypothetical protein Pfo_009237 [Paulownia fortunei]|nr:hypothetical protein Pfo_009237 [Paulownia fortunei]